MMRIMREVRAFAVSQVCNGKQLLLQLACNMSRKNLRRTMADNPSSDLLYKLTGLAWVVACSG